MDTFVYEGERNSDLAFLSEQTIVHSCYIWSKEKVIWKIDVDELERFPELWKLYTTEDVVEPWTWEGLYWERYQIHFPTLTMHHLL